MTRLQTLYPEPSAWRRLLDGAAENSPEPGAPAMLAVYGPIAARRGERFVLAQVGQSLDGRVATPTGDARDVSGPDGLRHLHRCRALVDAVLVGVGTAVADDPSLTVRLVEGPSPVRVVIDPRGRLPANAKMLHDGGPSVLVVRSSDATSPVAAETISLPARAGIAPADILNALAERGLRTVLVEGGGDTIARFLGAGLVDRLHVTVSPILIGSGPTGVRLPEITRLSAALRPRTTAYDLGSDVLFDCAF